MHRIERAAIAAFVVVLCASTVAVAQAPVEGGIAPEGVEHERLGRVWTVGLGDDTVHSGRTVLQPGAAMAPTRFSGAWTVTVDAGVLTIADVLGAPTIDDESWDEAAWAEAGKRADLTAGSTFTFGDGAVMSWANEGTAPAVLLTTAIVDDDDEPMTLAADHVEQRARPGQGEVVKRVVLTGPLDIGADYGYRITIRDRSGQLLGARIPRDAELRFARGWLAFIEEGNVRYGPAAFVDGNVNEVLLTWITNPCGPRTTIDIGEQVTQGQDPAAIRVTEHSRACDAAGKEVTVALRFRGGWTSVEDADVRLVYDH